MDNLLKLDMFILQCILQYVHITVLCFHAL